MPAIQNKLPAFARGRNKALTSLKFKTCAKKCYYTGLFKMIVGVLTTCHTQYT